MEDIPRAIIEQAQTGDKAAFESIYRASCGFVYNVVLRITSNREEAEEVAQDVFLKIYHHLKDFAFGSSFKTWAYRIAVNTALNACKRASRDTGRREDFETVMEKAASGADTAAEISQKEEGALNQARLEALLNKLNSQQRACIILREIEGLSYQEISEVLKINLNTVRSRLKRARGALMAYAAGGVIR
jgi:RNA polymerase sigma-70 factor (ECF subfamily)